MGNQQFTASGLYLQEARTTVQIHWDWGWKMQGLIIKSCETGIMVIGGAEGPMSTGQGAGSPRTRSARRRAVGRYDRPQPHL